MTTLLIVDDHPMVIEGLKTLLATAEVRVAGCAGNAFDAVAFLKTSPVDVVLLDINLPDVNGIDLCKKIKDEFPGVKVLAMSTFNERSYITRMMQHGASGYLLKNASQEEIIEAITAVHAGKKYLSFDVTETLLQTAAPENLRLPIVTSREREVLLLIADGLTNPQIAEKLFVSPLTVDSHRKNLLTKFNVRNTASLIALAMKNKLI